jgi:hypothetical protein
MNKITALAIGLMAVLGIARAGQVKPNNVEFVEN